MPNIKSAKKRDLIGKARYARNKAVKSELKTAIKKFRAAAAEGDKSAAEGAYRYAVKKVDQAVAKGVVSWILRASSTIWVVTVRYTR